MKVKIQRMSYFTTIGGPFFIDHPAISRNLKLILTVTLLGGDFDDFMDLTMNSITGGGHASTYDAMDATYGAPSESYNAPSSNYNAPQTSYNAPQTSYNAPQTSYNAPQTSYNAPQTSYNSPQATYGRVDFGINPKNQIEVSSVLEN